MTTDDRGAAVNVSCNVDHGGGPCPWNKPTDDRGAAALAERLRPIFRLFMVTSDSACYQGAAAILGERGRFLPDDRAEADALRAALESET